MAAPTDRAAAVRAALRTLVARNGFHGASMNAVAREAGVATGTAYTHYASKDELVLAAYHETKAALGLAATASLDPNLGAERRFHALWLACYRHLRANPDHAQFLLQVEHSPYRDPAHQSALANTNDPLLTQAARPDLAERLLPLPLDVLYELSFSAAVRLAASGIELTPAQLDEIADACWRAISRPEISSGKLRPATGTGGAPRPTGPIRTDHEAGELLGQLRDDERF
ncbi:MAG TPA: TetR/AcrR family transcriptional regulator [Pseudonocardia sp.]|jgi:AcrR family transcriptional regulator